MPANLKLVPKQPMGVMATHAEFDSADVLYISYGMSRAPNNMMEGAVWKYSPSRKSSPTHPAAPKKGTPSVMADCRSTPRTRTLMVQTPRPVDPGDEVYRTTDGADLEALFYQGRPVTDAVRSTLLDKPKDPIGRAGWVHRIDPFNPGGSCT